MRVVESGPVRVAIEVAREAGGSKFVQTISLSAGDAGKRLEFAERGRLEHQTIESEGVFPAGGFQPNGHLQLGYRNHRAAYREA